jgi:hypothetical protein
MMLLEDLHNTVKRLAVQLVPLNTYVKLEFKPEQRAISSAEPIRETRWNASIAPARGQNVQRPERQRPVVCLSRTLGRNIELT